jgi:hypothetical protein
MTSITRRNLLLAAMRAVLLLLALVGCSAIAEDLSGVHDFDFLFGDWQVHHRRLKIRLAGSTEWIEFDGTQSTRPALDGAGNVSENWFDVPRGAYRGVSVRSFDAKSGQWAIWWLDGRDPVRYIWSHITPTSAHWEQAFSPDGGKSWETNWVSDFKRATKGASDE